MPYNRKTNEFTPPRLRINCDVRFLIHELGDEHSRQICDVTEATIERWKRTNQTPRAVLYALMLHHTSTRWQLNQEAERIHSMAETRRATAEHRNKEQQATIERLQKLVCDVTGSANEPFYGDIGYPDTWHARQEEAYLKRREEIGYFDVKKGWIRPAKPAEKLLA